MLATNYILHCTLPTLYYKGWLNVFSVIDVFSFNLISENENFIVGGKKENNKYISYVL